MKRILIFSHALELGGAERSLIGLLHSLDYSEYEVDLFLMRHTGELMSCIPEQVNLLPEIPQYACLAVPIAQVLKSGHFGVAFGRFIGKRKAAAYVKQHKLKENAVSLEYSHKYTRAFMPTVGTGVYDLAVSFLTPHYFAAEKVQAKKKAAWIHTDYSRLAVNVESELAMWGRYDHIVGVSEDVVKSFTGVFPSLADKTMVMENTLPEKLIREQSKAFSAEDEMPADGSIRLLSIGRFSHAKNFDNVPDICARIRAAGLPVKWYLIGYGGEEELIRHKIAEAGMQENVIILGKRENPYPYIAACDLYVQPSRYEGKAVTVREAQLLGKPVVITDYPTSSSQLEDGLDGIIVPMDNTGCAKAISSLLKDSSILKGIQNDLSNKDFSNSEEVVLLKKLLEQL
ncbi:MAG: glycosyltransferase [Oscillospiraceae bacterium]|nr:glycosyltransferase [Oscillospiraceae bacterium]